MIEDKAIDALVGYSIRLYILFDVIPRIIMWEQADTHRYHNDGNDIVERLPPYHESVSHLWIGQWSSVLC